MRPRTTALLVSALLTAHAPAALAELRLHLAAHGAVALSGWQSRGFGPGGGASAALELTLWHSVGVVTELGFTALSRGDGALDAGVARPDAGGFGHLVAGVRLRPFTPSSQRAEGLWIDLLGGGALTGEAVRPTLLARVGYGFAVGGTSLGPWIGAALVLQTDGQSLPDDARIALAGVQWSLGGHAAPRPAPALPPAPPPPPPPPRCPAVDGPTLPDEDGDGCVERDRDSDQVSDRRDRCPDEAEDRDGHEDDDGCPDPDNDHDGILDPYDRCVDVPEVINGIDDDDGCPDEAPVHVQRGRIVLDERVHFIFDSSHLRSDSLPLLRAVARVMVSHPEYRTLRIEGHADDVGDDRYNFDLSYHRARSVMRFLASAGVSPGRMVALGFGRGNPLAQGTTTEARAENRRVEFVVDGHGSLGVARVRPGFVRVDDSGAEQRTEAP